VAPQGLAVERIDLDGDDPAFTVIHGDSEALTCVDNVPVTL